MAAGFPTESSWSTMDNSWAPDMRFDPTYSNASSWHPYQQMTYSSLPGGSSSSQPAFQNIRTESLENGPPGDREKPKKRFSKKAVQILEAYTVKNIENPFPSESEKVKLAAEAGLTKAQVSTWFTNTRRRRLKGMKEEVYEARNPRRKIPISPRKPLATISANQMNSPGSYPWNAPFSSNLYTQPPMQPHIPAYSTPQSMNPPAYPIQNQFLPPGPAFHGYPQVATPSPSYPMNFAPNTPLQPDYYGNNGNLYY